MRSEWDLGTTSGETFRRGSWGPWANMPSPYLTRLGSGGNNVSHHSLKQFAYMRTITEQVNRALRERTRFGVKNWSPVADAAEDNE